MGMHLAQMKMISLLKAMIPRVRRIEKDDPEILLNNTIEISALSNGLYQLELTNREKVTKGEFIVSH